jgi:hypothetical protein
MARHTSMGLSHGLPSMACSFLQMHSFTMNDWLFSMSAETFS